jgi:hypothetical protein
MSVPAGSVSMSAVAASASLVLPGSQLDVGDHAGVRLGGDVGLVAVPVGVRGLVGVTRLGVDRGHDAVGGGAPGDPPPPGPACARPLHDCQSARRQRRERYGRTGRPRSPSYGRRGQLHAGRASVPPGRAEARASGVATIWPGAANPVAPRPPGRCMADAAAASGPQPGEPAQLTPQARTVDRNRHWSQWRDQEKKAGRSGHPAFSVWGV